ncbi:scn4aa [Symbiodinium microadriaticum]|nr:scn4aa [Symbiodinium microadriaticum]
MKLRSYSWNIFRYIGDYMHLFGSLARNRILMLVQSGQNSYKRRLITRSTNDSSICELKKINQAELYIKISPSEIGSGAMSEAVKLEMQEVQRLLQIEFSQISERISQDLRHELSKFLAHWSEKDEKPIQDDDKILRPKVEVLPPPLPSLSSPPAQLVAPPTPATLNSMNEAEQDIARMRMKARTYTSTEGICGPLAEGSVTLFGTPKNAATARPPKGGVTAQRTSSLESGNQEKSDESKQDPGPPKTLGVVPREAHGPGEEKTEKRRGSNRVSKSVSMREPRSIFLHQITNRAGEEDEEDEDMDDPDEAIPCKKESLCTCIQKMCLWLVAGLKFRHRIGDSYCLTLPWLRCAWSTSTMSWASSSKLKIHEVMPPVCFAESRAASGLAIIANAVLPSP